MALTEISRVIAAADSAERAAQRAVEYAETSNRLHHAAERRLSERLDALEKILGVDPPQRG